MKDVVKRPLAALATLAVASVLSGTSFAADTPDISGIWWATEYHPKIELVGGGELPLTAAGKAAYEKNIKGLEDGSITDYARKYCTPDGVPRVLANPYPFEIVQAPPGQVTFLYELSHQVPDRARQAAAGGGNLHLPRPQRPFGRPLRRRHPRGRDRRL